MENKFFTNFMAFIITLLIFALWILPAYMLWHIVDPGHSGWGFLYLPIIALTILWGIVINNKYFQDQFFMLKIKEWIENKNSAQLTKIGTKRVLLHKCK